MVRIGSPLSTMDTITMPCFTFCAATLSYHDDGRSVGHTASVALQFETDQPIQSCWNYCKGRSMTGSTATSLSLYQGLFGPQILERRAYSMVGRHNAMQSSHTTQKHTKHKERTSQPRHNSAPGPQAVGIKVNLLIYTWSE
jgi:hypothetical protein